MCPDCKGFLHFSFVCKDGTPVYQCGWRGVAIYDTDMRFIGHSLDHSDHFYTRTPDRWVRVLPTKVGEKKEKVNGKNVTVYQWGFHLHEDEVNRIRREREAVAA